MAIAKKQEKHVYTFEVRKTKVLKVADNKYKLKSPDSVVDFCRDKLEITKKDCEFMVVITLDSNNQIRGYQSTRGTVNQAVVYPREVARFALYDNASAVILVHNHPSGNAKPSSCDLELTQYVKEALNTLNIGLIDHIILSDDSLDHFSFTEEGLL